MYDFNLPPSNPGPYSAHTTGLVPKGDVSDAFIADGLSRPLICTALRRWALSHEDVRRLVIYRTGECYSVALLIRNPTVCRIREFNQDLIAQLSELFPPSMPTNTYVVGNEFADAIMFRRRGAVTVIDKDD